jgi:hypothetical protein
LVSIKVVEVSLDIHRIMILRIVKKLFDRQPDELSNKAYQEILENDSKLIQKISQHMATTNQLSLLKSQGITVSYQIQSQHMKIVIFILM